MSRYITYGLRRSAVFVLLASAAAAVTVTFVGAVGKDPRNLLLGILFAFVASTSSVLLVRAGGIGGHLHEEEGKSASDKIVDFADSENRTASLDMFLDRYYRPIYSLTLRLVRDEHMAARITAATLDTGWEGIKPYDPTVAAIEAPEFVGTLYAVAAGLAAEHRHSSVREGAEYEEERSPHAADYNREAALARLRLSQSDIDFLANVWQKQHA